jgi:hypothetical protein
MSSGFVVSYALLWVLVIGQSVLVFVLLRTLGQVLYSARFHPSDEGVAVGEPLPDLELATLGASARVRSLLRRPFNVLVLAQVRCEFCEGAVRAAEAAAARLPAVAAHVLVATEELEEYSKSTHLSVVGLDRASISEKLKVQVTPFVFVTDSTATVRAKGVANDEAQLEALLLSAGEDIRAALADARADANDYLAASPTASV